MSYHNTPDVTLDAPTIVKMLASDVERLTVENSRLSTLIVKMWGRIRSWEALGDPKAYSDMMYDISGMVTEALKTPDESSDPKGGTR